MVFVVFGGLHTEAFAVMKQAVLAVCVSVITSQIVCFVYTKGDLNDEQKTRVLHAVSLLVGLVYCGSYFLEFAN